MLAWRIAHFAPAIARSRPVAAHPLLASLCELFAFSACIANEQARATTTRIFYLQLCATGAPRSAGPFLSSDLTHPSVKNACARKSLNTHQLVIEGMHLAAYQGPTTFSYDTLCALQVDRKIH
jgi:hypothetical protein